MDFYPYQTTCCNCNYIFIFIFINSNEFYQLFKIMEIIIDFLE